MIRGVTVAQANVDATGKFVLLDKDGNLTRDPKLAARKLPVVTDAKTLETLLAAAKAGGSTFKSREDHSDELGARLGFADNFQLIGDRVVCDLHVFDNYRNRDLFLETAAKTPKEVGISIDMNPSFEIFKDRALMRIEELLAVDVVDEGAITHDGLFLSRGVDKAPKVTLAAEPSTTMADNNEKKPATLEDCMSALTGLATTVGALAGTVAEMQKNSSASAEKMAAGQTELREKLAAATSAIAEVKQTAAALGQKPGNGGGNGGAADAAAETERQRLAAENEQKGKTYLDLVAAKKLEKKADLDAGKLKASDVHQIVMSEHPEKYREHLKAGGIYDESRDPNARGNARR